MTTMVHAWFDITAGVAGDMLLGSLLDAGADLTDVQQCVDAVIPGSVQITTRAVSRAGQRALKAHVALRIDDASHRTWRTIRELLEAADLPERVRQRALGTFEILAQAEAEAHGVDRDDVHFHEVGALDAIADVVGNCAALESLGIDTLTASPVAVGSGRVGTTHGDIPVPVPAVARMLLGWTTVPVGQGATSSEAQGSGHHHHHGHAHTDRESAEQPHAHPHVEGPAPLLAPGEGELATPTGMALIRALAAACEPLGSLQVERLGVGAGGRDPVGRPNIVRVLIGSAHDAPSQGGSAVVELAANVDDLDPRLWPDVIEACLAAGALDAWLVPIHMKKGRPAFTLHSLVGRETHDDVVETILARTTTLGVREVGVARTVLERTWVNVNVDGVPVPVKVGLQEGTIVNAAVEFEAVPELAESLGIAPTDALARATAAIVLAGLVPGETMPHPGVGDA